MERRQWVEEVRRELEARRLPGRYVERLVGELGDHAEDWEAGAGGARAGGIEEALGVPGDVAEAALVKYRAGRFAGRHPVWCFVVLPLPLVVLVMAGVVAGVVLISAWRGGGVPESLWALQAMRFLVVLPPIVLPAAWLCWVARRGAIGLRWPLAACAILGVCGGILSSGADGTPGHGRMFVGVGWPQTLMQWVQVCLPFVLLAWSYRGWRRVRSVRLVGG